MCTTGRAAQYVTIMREVIIFQLNCDLRNLNSLSLQAHEASVFQHTRE